MGLEEDSALFCSIFINMPLCAIICIRGNKMNPIPFYVAISVGIPETFLILLIGFSLFNLDISYKKAFIVSILSALIVYFVRQLPITFGVHTFIGIVILSFLAYKLLKTKLLFAFVATLAGLLTICMLECFVISIFFNITSINYDSFIINPWTHIILFLPEALIAVLICYLVKKHKFYIYNLTIGD